MQRNIALITGTSSGIGAEVATRLAREGWELVLWNRNPIRSAQARQIVLSAVPMSQVHSISADLSDPEQVAEGMKKVLRRVPHLDLMINNAGVLHSDPIQADDGHELHFRLHVLAPYELMVGLRQLLAQARAARVLNISSSAQHLASQLDVDALSNPSFRMPLVGPFAQSKLALSTLTAALAPAFQRDGTTIYSVAPGPTRTPMTESAGLPMLLRWMQPLVVGGVERAAERVLAAALTAELDAPPGSYLIGSRAGRAHADVLDTHMQWRLLEVVSKATGRCLPDLVDVSFCAPCSAPVNLSVGGVAAPA